MHKYNENNNKYLLTLMQIKIVWWFSMGKEGVLYTKSLISSKSPLDFSKFSLGEYAFLGNGTMVLDDTISVLGLLHPVNSRISSSF